MAKMSAQWRRVNIISHQPIMGENEENNHQMKEMANVNN